MTPSLNSNVFNGITRKLLLKYFTISGWDVGENSLFLKDLENADEVFLTNCSRGIISISEILGHNMKLNSNVTNEILYNLKLFMQGPAGD